MIKDLLKDGRKSLTEIADECDESKANICKRFKNMEKTGVIVGSTIQLDYACLGYNAVGNIDFRIKPENCDAAVEKLRSIPNVYHALRNQNGSVVNAVVTLKSMDEFNRIKDFIKRFPDVSDIVTNVWMGIRNIPENIAITKEQTLDIEKTPTHPVIRSNIGLDKYDKQIIEKLARNGRTPFANIAKELEIGTNTVIKKYNRLKENSVIKVSIQINPVKLGYKAGALFNLAFHAESELSTIVDKLSEIPDVKLIIKTSGRYDLAVFSLVKDLEELVSMQEKINNTAEITKMEFVLRKPHEIQPGYKEYISTF